MKMTFRWYGPKDPVTIDKIRQIPVIDSIVSAVYDVPAGELWPEESMRCIRNAAGPEMDREAESALSEADCTDWDATGCSVGSWVGCWVGVFTLLSSRVACTKNSVPSCAFAVLVM